MAEIQGSEYWCLLPHCILWVLPGPRGIHDRPPWTCLVWGVTIGHQWEGICDDPLIRSVQE
jgi:hypothetical protein